MLKARGARLLRTERGPRRLESTATPGAIDAEHRLGRIGRRWPALGGDEPWDEPPPRTGNMTPCCANTAAAERWTRYLDDLQTWAALQPLESRGTLRA